jgi:hypothetical protein
MQTIAERMVEKVDDQLKEQIVHWAAYYVRTSQPLVDEDMVDPRTGTEDEDGLEEDFSHRGVHRKGHDVSRGTNSASLLLI